VLGLVLIGFASGCGGGSANGLAALAPPDAPLYAEVAIQPDGDLADSIASLTGAVAGIDDPAAAIVAEVDRLLADSGTEVTYADDIEPWLGGSAALFVRSFEPPTVAGGWPDLAVMLDVVDDGAAKGFVDELADEDPSMSEERTYADAEYRYSPEGGGIAVGIVDDALVIGTEMSFQLAADASAGESLGASDEFATRTDALPDDPLATVYLEPGAVIQAAIGSNEIARADAELIRPLLAGPLSAPVAMSLSATDHDASLDLVSTVEDVATSAGESELLERLPAGSWFATAVPEFGPTVERAVDQLGKSGRPGAGSLQDAFRRETGLDLGADVAVWLGDVAAFVEGTPPLNFTAGVLGETDDPGAPRKLLERAGAVASREAGLPVGPAPDGASDGFTLGLPGGALDVGVFGDLVVAAAGTAAADVIDPESTLAHDERFQAAANSLGDELSPVLYVYLPSFLATAELGGAGDDPDYSAARHYLETLEYLVAGTKVEDGLARSRLSVGLDPGSG
jgi:hypothetical protein